MGLFDKLLSKDSAKATQPAPKKAAPERRHSDEELKAIAEYIKNNTIKPVYKIKSEISDELSIADSKFGGYPYWPEGMEYPVKEGGQPLIMLAQINFQQEQLDDELLPDHGILQFFIDCDDLYGLDFDDQTRQDSFRIVYHEEIDSNVSENSVKGQGIKTNLELDHDDEYFPFDNQYKLQFTKDTDFLNNCHPEFEKMIKEALIKLFNIETELSVWKYFTNDEFNLLWDEMRSEGHKILGYPFFTQTDPRPEPVEENYDTLLLQIDSADNTIIWGDSGVGNFFINKEKLKARDFSDVMYNWDCF